MAIEKTVFVERTAAELGAYLSANASDYFDSITVSEGVVIFKIGEQTVLTIEPEASSMNGIKLDITPVGAESAVTRAFKGNSQNTQPIRAAYKTDKGILLASQSSYFLLICKNAGGDVCLVTSTFKFPTSSTSDKPVEIWDIENNVSPYTVYTAPSQQPAAAASFGTVNTRIASLFPLAAASGSILSGVYMSYLSPYVGDYIYGGMEIVLGGETHYAYTGSIALEE